VLKLHPQIIHYLSSVVLQNHLPAGTRHLEITRGFCISIVSVMLEYTSFLNSAERGDTFNYLRNAIWSKVYVRYLKIYVTINKG
jgi:hypothetical protein